MYFLWIWEEIQTRFLLLCSPFWHKKYYPGVRREQTSCQLSNDPKSLWCAEAEDLRARLELRDIITKEKHDSTQSFSKASHLLWMQHRDSVMKHQNKESRNTDKAFPQQWVFKRMKSSESSKTQDSQSSKQNCAIQKHRDVNLTFKGLYITKKKWSHNECEKSIQWGLFPVC